MRRFLALIGSSAVLLSAAASAHGASIVYIDAQNDVAVARPDGSLAKKVTHNDGHAFRGISVADDGGITAFFSGTDSSGNSNVVVYNQDGTIKYGPFLFERSGLCGGLFPYMSSTSPDGVFVAASYQRGSDNCIGGTPTQSLRIINRTTATIGTGTYPSYDNRTEPHWIRHPDQRLAAISGKTAIQVWQNDAAHMQDWITVNGGYEVDGFDVHPTANKILMDLSDSSQSGVKSHTLALLTYTELSTGSATPTLSDPQFVCSVENYVTNDIGGGRPVWSPDGTQIAWGNTDGIYVSPAPVNNGGTCVLQPKLVIPNGTAPHWASFDVTVPTPTPAPGGGTATPTPTPAANKPGTTPGTGGASGGGSTTPPTFTAPTAAPAKGAFTLALTVPQAATVTVTVYTKSGKKPLGVLTYKATKGKFKHKITKVGGRKLKKGTYRIVITSGATSQTLTVKVK